VFVGHAYDDDLIGAAPYLAIIVLSASYVLRPTLVAWGLLFGAFVSYAALIVAHPGNGPRDEWLFFMLLGLVPALLLWFARPRELQTKGKAKTMVVPESQRDPDTGSG